MKKMIIENGSITRNTHYGMIGNGGVFKYDNKIFLKVGLEEDDRDTAVNLATGMECGWFLHDDPVTIVSGKFVIDEGSK